MNLKRIRNHHLPIHRLLILSFEGDIYMAEVQIHDRKFLVLNDKDNKPRVFPSLASVRDAFDGLAVCDTEHVHYSAYDEMIGLRSHDSESMGQKDFYPINSQNLH
ncbi:hypothetical protein KCM76_09865 [Zooshikella marina]|uniref:Na(+)-translocating NADH-quinone reductase subunit B n=1 Tax=Zooshikella ganghwensis TaxID=202772 RepID=A0A4V1IN41_9GAMM|nr:DUF6482 family protein [Zooshikella ganghwensis]MBU2706294.1 hypothetical protein [Zooshikella ganghwensis]RDH42411.1 hypothetical protein B9G39_02555 [Zooshikella ganghwensis]